MRNILIAIGYTTSVVHVILFLWVLGLSSLVSAQSNMVIIRGPYESEALRLIQSIAGTFPAKAKLNIACDDYASVGRFCDDDNPYNMLIQSNNLTPHDLQCWRRRFPIGTSQPQMRLIGQLRVVFIANKSNPVLSLNAAAIRASLSITGKRLKWTEIGGAGSAIRCFGPFEKTWAREAVLNKCLTYWEMTGPSIRMMRRLEYRDDIVSCADAKEVVTKVRGDRNALGFFPWNDSLTERDVANVTVLSIAPADKSPILPSLLPVIQYDYPISEPVILYVHPSAPQTATDFMWYCVSDNAVAMAAENGLITPYAESHYYVNLRLADMRAGKGDPIKAAGTMHGTFLMNDLALEYTKAQAVVQLRYAARQDAEAIGEFINGQDVLVTQARVQTDQLPYRVKAKWDALDEETPNAKHETQNGPEVQREVKPGIAMARLTPYCLAARSVAIVVPSANKLTALTAEQVRAIFTGKVKDWQVLAAMSGDTRATAIHCYGLADPDPAFRMVYQNLDFRDPGRLARKKDGPAVLAALAIDPQGIGFVNTVDLPTNAAGLKQMSIKIMAIGEGKDAVRPTIETITTGKYLLSERLYLYTNPRASPAAQAFIAYIQSPAIDPAIFQKDGYMAMRTHP